MRKYLHLGYPKNFSTSLQRNYFSQHKEIYHLGIGVNSNVGYIDNLTSSLFEVYLKSSKGFKYEEQYSKLKSHISKHYDKARKSGRKCFGASSEHFSFGFTYESLDFQTKINRAIDLFGVDDLNLILVIRNQSDLLKSLYRESVRVGLPYTFKEYISNLYKFQDRNYLYDLRYDLVYNYLSDIVPKENIHFLIFEELRDEKKSMVVKDGRVNLVDKLSNILGVRYENISFEHFNEALSDREVSIKAKLNKSHRHDLGREMLFSAEIHRQAAYFNRELGLYEPEEVLYEDVITKRRLIEESRKEAKKYSKEIDDLYLCDEKESDQILSMFNKGNSNFVKQSKVNLPQSYFDMDFNN